MIFESLLLSDKYDLDYIELTELNPVVSASYDFYAFNYHHVGFCWLDTKSIRSLPGLKLTFVLEVAPQDPFTFCPEGIFDVNCCLDPTLAISKKSVFAFPRPLRLPRALKPYVKPAHPVIGTFGFATSGKGFELVVDAVNREFDKAVVRINIPPATFADSDFWRLQRQDYKSYLATLAKHVARKDIQVVVTHEYMSDFQLIDWCSQNTLNCFLYNRIQPGLAATTDQAIASLRPLAVSTNETFRHIHPFITPYPRQSLTEAIANNAPGVLEMRNAWAPINFAKTFERALDSVVLSTSHSTQAPRSATIRLKELKTSKSVFFDRLEASWNRATHKTVSLFSRAITFSSLASPSDTLTSSSVRTLLFVSHKKKRCGIHSYGLNVFSALQKSRNYSFIYAECSNQQEIESMIHEKSPLAIIYNYYPATMPWLSPKITRSILIPQLGIMHEVTQDNADHATNELFDFHLCPDPTLVERNSLVFKTGRLIPPYINTVSLPEIPTIGSFGFGFSDKGFERVLTAVQDQFDSAHVRFHIPFNDVVGTQMKRDIAATLSRCQNILKKPGLRLTITHNFIDQHRLHDFLAGNSVNVFLYDTDKHRGISSVIDHALAVQRPIAISKCGMFRHILNATPSICIEDSSLREITNNGIVPLVPFYNDWSEANFILTYEKIIEAVLSPRPKRS